MSAGPMLEAIYVFVGDPTTPFQADVAYMSACFFSVIGVFMLIAILAFAVSTVKGSVDYDLRGRH